ncbi:unnamed protein product [Closterium sp. NIES-53]
MAAAYRHGRASGARLVNSARKGWQSPVSSNGRTMAAALHGVDLRAVQHNSARLASDSIPRLSPCIPPWHHRSPSSLRRRPRRRLPTHCVSTAPSPPHIGPVLTHRPHLTTHCPHHNTRSLTASTIHPHPPIPPLPLLPLLPAPALSAHSSCMRYPPCATRHAPCVAADPRAAHQRTSPSPPSPPPVAPPSPPFAGCSPPRPLPFAPRPRPSPRAFRASPPSPFPQRPSPFAHPLTRSPLCSSLCAPLITGRPQPAPAHSPHCACHLPACPLLPAIQPALNLLPCTFPPPPRNNPPPFPPFPALPSLPLLTAPRASASPCARCCCAATQLPPPPHPHSRAPCLPGAWLPAARPAVLPLAVARPRQPRTVRAAAEGDMGGMAAIVGGAVAVVGVAAVLVGLQRGVESERAGEDDGAAAKVKVPCAACKGSGICSECQGEGFVSKAASARQPSRGLASNPPSAQRSSARVANKWRYCVACNGARVCGTCEGRRTVDA